MPINRPNRVYVRITDADGKETSQSFTIYGETPKSAAQQIRDHFDSLAARHVGKQPAGRAKKQPAILSR